MDKNIKGYYTPHFHFKTQLYKIIKNNWYDFQKCYSQKYEYKFGSLHDYKIKTIDKFLECSNPHHGFAYVECTNDKCQNAYIVPFTCKMSICPSCAEKNVLEFSDWLVEEVLFDVYHKHTVLTMPYECREYFRAEPKLLSYLAKSAGKLLIKLARQSANGEFDKKEKSTTIPKDAMPGIIIRIETAGGNLKWNPHMHCLESQGCYSPIQNEDRYYPGRYLPYRILRCKWRDVVLNLLHNFKKISTVTFKRLKQKYRKGYNVNSEIRDFQNDKQLMYRQAQYIQKAPLSETRIVHYNKNTQKVTIKFRTYNNRTKKSYYTTETISAFELIIRLIQHIHYPRMHYTRYFGQYSVKRRGLRRKMNKKSNQTEPGKNRTDYRSSWRRLIWKVYGMDPLMCPLCGSEMEIYDVVSDNVEEELKKFSINTWYYNDGEDIHIINKRDP